MNRPVERPQQENSFKIELINNGRIQFTTHTTLRGVSPHQVYDFLVNINEEHYRLFHPKDHKAYKVLHQPKSGIVGTIVYLKEKYENGYISSAKATFIEANPGHRITNEYIRPPPPFVPHSEAGG